MSYEGAAKPDSLDGRVLKPLAVSMDRTDQAKNGVVVAGLDCHRTPQWLSREETIDAFLACLHCMFSAARLIASSFLGLGQCHGQFKCRFP